MRVVEADDVEPARPSVPAACDVILRVDEEPRRRSIRNVPRRKRLDNLVATAQQEPTALVWRRLAGMTHDGLGGTRFQIDDFRLQTSYFVFHKASTTRAIPIPPPIHNDATPYRSCLARKAWISVVSTRAPLAPIG